MGSQRSSLNDEDKKTPILGRKDRRPRSSSGAGKVSTSKGLRGGRLRLSDPTAIEFYDVQDRLGCNRQTEVIDWFLQNAKSAIDALSGPLETEDRELRKQSFSFPVHSSSSSPFQSYPPENFSQKGILSVFSPTILNATPAEFSGIQPLFSSQNNVGIAAPSHSVTFEDGFSDRNCTRRRIIEFKVREIYGF